MPENPARLFLAMVENHWSKLNLIILSAVSGSQRLHRGHRSLPFPKAKNGLLCIFLSLCLPDAVVTVHGMEEFLPNDSRILPAVTPVCTVS